MTAGSSCPRTELLTDPINIGPAVLSVPPRPPIHTHGTYGEMWQWIGDGRRLFSLLLTARYEGEKSAKGVQHRLIAEVERIREPMLVSSEDEAVRTEVAIVSGARAAFVAHVDGIRDGVPVRNLVMAAATHERTYLFHILVPDTPVGHEYASSVASSFRLGG